MSGTEDGQAGELDGSYIDDPAASAADAFRMATWITKLVHEPKKRYATQYAEYLLGRRPQPPTRPVNDWVDRTERKLERLMSTSRDKLIGPGTRMSEVQSARAEAGSEVDQLMSMLGF